MEAELIAEGYEIYPATFTGDFGPNGEAMTFSGTIESVIEQVHTINPGYNFNATASDVEARGKGDWRDRDVARKDCDTGDFASGYYISDGIAHLRGIKNEKCKLGSKGCARVSCSWKSAIFVCWDPNDDSPRSYEKSWDYVADYAAGIAAGEWCDRISVPQDPWSVFLVRGKVWDTNGMAVRVGWDKC